jgi:hypothetical protein
MTTEKLYSFFGGLHYRPVACRQKGGVFVLALVCQR